MTGGWEGGEGPRRRRGEELIDPKSLQNCGGGSSKERRGCFDGLAQLPRTSEGGCSSVDWWTGFDRQMGGVNELKCPSTPHDGKSRSTAASYSFGREESSNRCHCQNAAESMELFATLG